MTHPRLIAMLFTGTAMGLLAAAARWRRAETVVPSPRAIIVSHAAPPAVAGDSVLDAAQDATITNDPFRLANEPSSVRYDPATDGGAPMPSTGLVRPTLVLKAIIGGPPWQAVIDGIPGQPSGTVAAAGARFDKLLVRSVSRDSVVVQGPDTSWTLGFRSRM